MNVAASQLSAMVDDELDRLEIDLVLRRLCRDDDLQSCWSRYHLISDVMQSHLPDVLAPDFTARIRQAVAVEPLPLQTGKALPAWYKPATGFGLAASVVLVALFGFKLIQTDAPLAPTTLSVASNPSPSIPAPFAVRAAARQTDAPNEPVEARLSRYLVNHNGYASLSSMHGMLPYVRMVGYQQPSR
ncbi:MAG: RseA family anti-sigma factor [Candidatus Competibacter sp.]|nr:RseA family anti-sigma factor [Candidatus Competibacter sp.]MDG4582474.1 RseA family anti-sigma factor [Candidatus Competibacter sp.]